MGACMPALGCCMALPSDAAGAAKAAPGGGRSDRGRRVIIGLYLLIVWKGIRIARHAPDLFGCYLAVGLTAALGLQICINMGVTLGLLPTKGLTLPFLSYGGTSLVLNMATIGILMNISASGKTARGVG